MLNGNIPDAMFMQSKELLYNPDSSYNAVLFDSEENLIVPEEEYERIIKDYHEMKKIDPQEAWDKYHTPEWTYKKCIKWCEEHSANHKF